MQAPPLVRATPLPLRRGLLGPVRFRERERGLGRGGLAAAKATTQITAIHADDPLEPRGLLEPMRAAHAALCTQTAARKGREARQGSANVQHVAQVQVDRFAAPLEGELRALNRRPQQQERGCMDDIARVCARIRGIVLCIGDFDGLDESLPGNEREEGTEHFRNVRIRLDGKLAAMRSSLSI